MPLSFTTDVGLRPRAAWRRECPRWPARGALALFAALLLLLGNAALDLTGGNPTYALDDAYIHLAIAKNLLTDGTWGINPGEYVSADSSLVWPWLLAATGATGLSPLLLNILLGTGLLLLCARVLNHSRPLTLFLVLAVIAIGMPMAPLAFTGMEHLLHTLVAVAFAAAAVGRLSGEAVSIWTLPLLAALLTAARFEGMFEVSVVCALLLLRGGFGAAIGCAVAAALPVLISGGVSLLHGNYFWPNSLLLKSTLPQQGGWAELPGLMLRKAESFVAQPHLWSLGMTVLVMFGLLASRRRAWAGRGLWFAAIFLGSLLLHAAFGAYGWFYRYEAYLVALGVVALATALVELKSLSRGGFGVPLAALFSAIIVIGGVAPRALAAHREVPLASRNIHDQQLQMARFLRDHYAGSAVAANDIGAIAFFSGVRVVDLFGLGNIDVARLRIEGEPSAAAVERITRAAGVRVAVLYPTWLGPYIPEGWVEVGRMRIEQNVVVASDEVAWYAVGSEEEKLLAERLAGFAASLPPGVSYTPARGSMSLQPHALEHRLGDVADDEHDVAPEPR